MRFLAATFLATTAILVGLLIFPCSRPAAAGGGLNITEMAVTTKVVRGNPIDSVWRISSSSVKALYCFTRIINNSGEETTLKHVWYRNGEQVRESTLSVKGKKWRTWSKREIDRESVGNWRVDALDSDGKILKSVEFRIN